MRYPVRNHIRPLRDDEVDRAEVEVRLRMELTVTNRSKAYPKETESWLQKRREDDIIGIQF